MRAPTALRRGASARLADIDQILEGAYGTPEVELGNKDDPLDEAIYIILSFQTDLARTGATWSKLRAAYPTWDSLERAPTREIAAVLREGGLHRQKARTLKRLLARVRRIVGELSLNILRSMNEEDAQRILIDLPGLSWKGARCVLLYSLNRDVFPVDGNTFRILKRTGVLRTSAVYRRRSLHDALQSALQPQRRRALHVNLVIHGQRTCLARAPRCSLCPLTAACPKVGIRRVALKRPRPRGERFLVADRG
jgi:endonuclease III